MSGRSDARTKKPPQDAAVQKMERAGDRLNLLHEAGLDGLDRNPNALDRAVGQLDPDALEIRTEFPLRDLRHVRTDAAALLRDTFAVNDTALNGTPASDYTNSGHGEVPRLKKGSE
jgi:hypothetical protein